ncbi:MFS transporter [Actinokineospora enzanensis]|uniref:MFS transporter n=1 Tax=Actinokineospora enzanensis TaxID=155975 RepID=UPI0003720F4C|nr:MFS transporter [Actinokineospora enzanensis]
MTAGTLGTYRRLFAVPGLRGLFTWAMLGRLYLPGTPLALTFLIAGWTGSYVAAGVVGGAYTVGVSLGGPLRGKSADRGDPVRLLAGLVSLYSVTMVLLAFLPTLAPARLWPLATAVACLVGLVQPPVTQIARAAYPRLITDPGDRQSMYAVEATVQESLWVVGPVLVAAVVGVVDPRAGVLLSATLAVVGSTGFARALHRVGLRTPVERPAGSTGSVLRAPGLRAALTMGLCMFAPLAMVDMTIVAWTRDTGRPAAAGLLVAVWSIGSAVGGVVAGARSGTARLGLRTLMMAAGFGILVPLLPPVIPGSVWLLAAALGIGGLTVAPALAANNHRVGELAPEGRTAEVFGWMMTAATLGSSLLLPVVGWLLDHIGPAAGVGAATVVAMIASGLSLAVPVPGRTAVPA